jgi:GT2 family glycosyltransferase
MCMPYWKRQAELDRSLAAYRRLYGHLDLEISICDDGSPDPVVAPGCIVTTLPRKATGMNPCVPMNAAVRASSGEVIVLTNPEIEHQADVLTGMQQLLRGPTDYVTAACRDADGTWLAGPEFDRQKAQAPMPPESNYHFCAMLHRSLFEAAGGFDDGYRAGRACEDNDFLWRCFEAGANFIQAPGQVLHHRTPHQFVGSVKSNMERLRSRWADRWRGSAC